MYYLLYNTLMNALKVSVSLSELTCDSNSFKNLCLEHSIVDQFKIERLLVRQQQTMNYLVYHQMLQLSQKVHSSVKPYIRKYLV